MIHWLRLFRIGFSVPLTLTLALMIYYAAGEYISVLPWAAGAFLLVLSGAYAVNDAFDVRADRINAPRRPVCSGKIKRIHAIVAGSILIISGCGLSFLSNEQFAANLCMVAAILLIYDIYSKRMGVIKIFYAAVLMTFIYPLAISAAGELVKQSPRVMTFIFFVPWMFFSTCAYGILADLRDVKGDKTMTSAPYHHHRHPFRWRIVSTIMTFAGFIFLPGAMFNGCKWLYGVMLIPVLLLVSWSVLAPVKRAAYLKFAEFFAVGLAAACDVFILGM